MGAVASGLQLPNLVFKAAAPQEQRTVINATIQCVSRLRNFEDALARVDYRLVELALERRVNFSGALTT
jgi:hypothetical protein